MKEIKESERLESCPESRLDPPEEDWWERVLREADEGVERVSWLYPEEV